MPNEDEWYKESFAADYVRIYQHRDHSEAERAVTSLLARLHLPPDAICLDLCCGFGRHLAQLNREGCRCYGIDLSEPLLQLADQQHNASGRLAQADMRRLPFHGCFHFVFSFFSSFGYFASDSENTQVLRELARVLEDGGGFLIDYLNPALVQANLVPEDQRDGDGFSLTQRRWIDAANNSVDKELIFRDDNGERRYRERVKLYGVDDFQRLCDLAGLRVAEVLGDPEGGPFKPDSKRMIIVGKKN